MADQAQTVAAADDHRGALYGLDDLEWLGCTFPDGITVEAEARPDLPWRYMFAGEHPVHGLRYFRARRRGAARDEIGPSKIEVWDVTEAYARLAGKRLKRGLGKAALCARVQRSRIKASAYQPPPGAPTPERRRRGGIAREVIADPEDGEPRLIHRAPDRLVAMYKRRALDRRQLEAAMEFHETFIAAGLDLQRAADMGRVPGNLGGGEADQVLDARAEVWAIYDHIGGRGSLSARVLRAIVGEGRTINECVRGESKGSCGTSMKNRVAATLSAALDGVCGYHSTKHRHEAALRTALKDAVSGALSQGA